MNMPARLLFLLLTAMLPLPLCAQVVDASKCDSSAHILITQSAAILRTAQLIGIDSVIQLQTAFEKPAKEAVLVVNYDPYYYWFRIVIKNPQEYDRKLMLLMAPIGMYEGRLFQKINNQWKQVAQTGLKYKFRDRSYQFTHHVFPFTLPQASTDTLYLSVDASNAYKAFGFALLQPKELKIFENNIYFVFGIIVGLLLLFFVLNISLFFALKQQIHLWYALYVALLFLVVMKNDHLDQQFLGMDSELAFRLTPYMTIGALAIAVLMHVGQIFLENELKDSKWLRRLSSILKINVLCSAIVHFFVFLNATDYRIHSIVFSWAKLSTLLGICMIITNCVYSLKKGNKGALFLLCGSLVFMIGSVQRLFFPSTLSFLFPPTTFHVGIIVEIFVITLGLIYRYWSEKDRQKQEEEKIQLDTINGISQKIHDDVGQILTLANMNLRTIDTANETMLRGKIEEAKQLISQSIGKLGGLSRTLKNETVLAEDLASEIRDECEKVNRSGAFKVVFTANGRVRRLVNKNQAIIINIIKEALQNAMKHAQASEVQVSLKAKTHTIVIRIQDNGVGFDVAKASINSNGLENIKNSSLMLKGSCQIESQVGAGTDIIISIPI